MKFEPIDFSELPSDRKEELEKIERYDLFKTMFYRTNLWQHSHRVMWLVEDLLETAGDYIDVDTDKARVMAFIHDDPEILITDIASARKDQMTKVEKDIYNDSEEKAACVIGKRFGPKIHGYNYEKLLVEMSRLSTPEAQLVSLADKVEAHNETMHEIFAGNSSFTFAICHTVRKLTKIMRDLNHLEKLVSESGHPFVEREVQVPMKGQFMIKEYESSPFMKPHTDKSIRMDIDFFPHHSYWRKVMLERGGDMAEKWMLEQKESF